MSGPRPPDPPRACVIGWPVAHSRSPLIHAHWLRAHGLPGRYERAAVPPGELPAFLRAMAGAGFVGGNVTVPHKERAAALCDRLTPAAARTGSVNTLWFEGGALWGDTTDGAGFLGALDAEAPGWDARARGDDHRAVVLGAGGAALAVVDALVARGVAEVIVASRTVSRADALVGRVGGRAVPMAALGPMLATAGLLVNTTPAGMAGQDAPNDALDLDLSPLPDHAVVDDIVYVPALTPLLARARARGLRTVGGLSMLLHQAAPGFARWFGVEPAVTAELRALVQADIDGADIEGSRP